MTPDLGAVQAALICVAVSAAVGGLGWFIAVRCRHRSLTWLLAVIASTTLISAAAGVGCAAGLMLTTRHDTVVVAVVIATSLVVGAFGVLRVALTVRSAVNDVQTSLDSVGSQTPPSMTDGPAELQQLSRFIRATHERVEAVRDGERELEAGRRQLIAWISHDLRTPLAAMRAMIEAIQDGIVTDEDMVADYHTRLRAEVDRLSTLVSDLFELSRLQIGNRTPMLTDIALSDLVSDALASAEPVAGAAGVRLVSSGADTLPVLRLDAYDVNRALSNVLDNAIRHTPKGSTVKVLGGTDPGFACVTIADGCGGIPAADLPRVFDTGFRGEASRRRLPSGGAGLGLSIAKHIIEANQGRIDVTNVDAGCAFTLRFPQAAESPS